MKTPNILRLSALFILFIAFSCNKDQSTNNEENPNLSLHDQLSQKLKSFEVVELDESQISQLESSQQDAMVNLDFLDGKYQFELRNTSPKMTVEVIDDENNSTEDINMEYSVFDNFDQANSSQYASFTLVNGQVNGSFKKDGIGYTLSPAQGIVNTASSTTYVIYPNEDYKAPELSEFDVRAILDPLDYVDEDKELDKQLGDKKLMAVQQPYTVKVNAYTTNDFRIHCRKVKQRINDYMINNIVAVNQKMVQGNMPVRVVFNKITHLKSSTIPTNNDVSDVRKNYFNPYVNKIIYKDQAQVVDAFILYTANTTKTAAPSPWTIGRKHYRPERRKGREFVYTPTVVMQYIDGVSRRDNWLAHEIGHMLGCWHIPRNNSKIPGVMNPNIWSKPAEYKAQTKANMTKYLSVNNYGLNN